MALDNCDQLIYVDVQYAYGTSDHLHHTNDVSKYSKAISIRMKRLQLFVIVPVLTYLHMWVNLMQ